MLLLLNGNKNNKTLSMIEYPTKLIDYLLFILDKFWIFLLQIMNYLAASDIRLYPAKQLIVFKITPRFPLLCSIVGKRKISIFNLKNFRQ